MNILMTGGTGLIGRAFVSRFTEHRYTVLTRSRTGQASVLPGAVTLVDSLDAFENLDEFDAVINLAGEPIMDKRWSEQQKQVICESRWQTTQRLVDLFAASGTPPTVFLSGSAIGVYGDRGDEILTESVSVTVTDFPSKICLEWENIARKAEAYTRVVLLRTGIVLDAHGGALNKMLLPFKLGLGGRIGHGRQYMSWIHYQDQVDAMQFLLTQDDVSGAVNLVAPNPVTNREFTRSLGRALGRPALLPMPALALSTLLGESSCLLLDSQRVTPQKLQASGYQFAFSDLMAAFSDLL
ncbi:MAG: TIGR01777 family protein [Ketobacter sp.]|nr:MAG: TIGR01777 family protein [Ketobacter sp.]